MARPEPRERGDAALAERIRAIHTERDGAWGHPRVTTEPTAAAQARDDDRTRSVRHAGAGPVPAGLRRHSAEHDVRRRHHLSAVGDGAFPDLTESHSPAEQAVDDRPAFGDGAFACQHLSLRRVRPAVAGSRRRLVDRVCEACRRCGTEGSTHSLAFGIRRAAKSQA